MPDPQDPQTFERSKLNWNELAQLRHGELLELYRRLIALRHAEPAFSDPSFVSELEHGEDWLWFGRGDLAIVLNFADESRSVALAGSDLILSTADDTELQDAAILLPRRSAAVLRRSVTA